MAVGLDGMRGIILAGGSGTRLYPRVNTLTSAGGLVLAGVIYQVEGGL